MTPYALLFTLSAIGLSITEYLIRHRRAASLPVCPIGEDCSVVLTSKYSKTLGVQNDVLGLLFYLFALFMTAFMVLELPYQTLISLGFKSALGVASLTSLYFTYLQWRVIKAWCFWCLGSAFTILAMDIIILYTLIK